MEDGYDTDGNKISEKVQGYGGTNDILRDLKYSYDEYNHLEKIGKPDDSVIYKHFGYTNDRLTNETDHNSRATGYGYDDIGRQNLVTLPDPGLYSEVCPAKFLLNLPSGLNGLY